MASFDRRKAFGQHFLKDAHVIHAIVDQTKIELEKSPVDTLLEIGPGEGAITHPLLASISNGGAIPKRILIIEKDFRLADEWMAKAQASTLEMSVKKSDFLDLHEEEWLSRCPLGIVSNLPYSAGTAILDRLSRHPEAIVFMILMFQAEVAERIRALPSTKARGSLSLWVQNNWNIQSLLRVNPSSFKPPPKVFSEILIFYPRPVPQVPGTRENPILWEDLLKSAFAYRRKMLRVGLKRASNPRFLSALERSGVDGTRRAESLDWSEWCALFSACGS